MAQRLYKTVADRLLAIIDSGQYAVGSRLPAERDLAIEFDVSRPTIREAVIALEIAGRVEVRKGSGVYVTDNKNGSRSSLDLDVGPFELTEARMLIEGEAASLAASLITDEQLSELGSLIKQMVAENDSNIAGEAADKEFHMVIARATRNSALVAIIDDLWSLRDRSALTSRMYDTVRMTGVKPSIEEHWAIHRALEKRNPAAARAAMRTHLSRVIDTMFQATEIEAMEEVKRRVTRDRERFEKLRDIS